jgi:hypothetical protein
MRKYCQHSENVEWIISDRISLVDLVFSGLIRFME